MKVITIVIVLRMALGHVVVKSQLMRSQSVFFLVRLSFWMRINFWLKWCLGVWSTNLRRGDFTEGTMSHRDCRANQNPFALLRGRLWEHLRREHVGRAVATRDCRSLSCTPQEVANVWSTAILRVLRKDCCCQRRGADVETDVPLNLDE